MQLVIESVKKVGPQHEGINRTGTWVDVNGGRSFQLCDSSRDIDPVLRLKANFAWNDPVRMEDVHVLDATEMMKLMESMR